MEILMGWEKQIKRLFHRLSWNQILKSASKDFHGPLPDDEPLMRLIQSQEIQQSLRIKLNHPLLIKSSCKSSCQEIVIHAQRDWIIMEENHSCRMLYFVKKGIHTKHWIRLFLNGVYTIASGMLPKKTKKVSLSCVNTENFETMNFEIPKVQECMNYLNGLIQEMDTIDAARLFPLEAVLELEKETLRPEEFSSRLEEWVDKQFNSNQAKISSQFGPLDFPEDITFPSNPQVRLKDRFGLMFKSLGNPV